MKIIKITLSVIAILFVLCLVSCGQEQKTEDLTSTARVPEINTAVPAEDANPDDTVTEAFTVRSAGSDAQGTENAAGTPATEAVAPVSAALSVPSMEETFTIGDFYFHYGRYTSDDRSSSYYLYKDGTLKYESDNGSSYTAVWEVKHDDLIDGTLIFLTDADGVETRWWYQNDCFFDAYIDPSITYRYSGA